MHVNSEWWVPPLFNVAMSQSYGSILRSSVIVNGAYINLSVDRIEVRFPDV